VGIVHLSAGKGATVSEHEHDDEKVEEAAARAARSVEHRRQMQRQSARAEAAEGVDESELKHDAAAHGEAAEAEEDAAQNAAREADESAET
jgi:hypothetical protein